MEIDGVRYLARSIEWDFFGGTVRLCDVTNDVETYCQDRDGYDLTVRMMGVSAVNDCRYPDEWQRDTSFNAYGCHVILYESDDGWGYEIASPDYSHCIVSEDCMTKSEVIATADELAKAWGKLYPKQGE